MAASVAITTTLYLPVATVANASVYVADAAARSWLICDAHQARLANIDAPTSLTVADQLLSEYAEDLVQILSNLDSTGSHYLYLTEL